jgi:hypothetical protein
MAIFKLISETFFVEFEESKPRSEFLSKNIQLKKCSKQSLGSGDIVDLKSVLF